MPTSLSSKLTRMTSVKLSFHKKRTSQESDYTPRTRPTSVINPLVPTEAPIEHHDTFDSFFFNDKRCQDRALFIASRLKQSLDGIIKRQVTTTLPHSSVDSFWRTVTHRLYTLNYILFVLPSHSQSRADFLNRIEADLALKSDGQELFRKGGMEAHFAVRYALSKRRRKTLLEDAFEAEKRNGGNVAGAVLGSTSIDQYVEQARIVIAQCLDSEAKLSNAQKDELYVEESSRAGLLNSFQIHIELEEDRDLRHRLKRLVQEQNDTQNPFEDEDLVVLEDCVNKRQVDSGFYDDWHYNSSVIV